MPLGELHEYERNAKAHDDENVSAIKESIARFGMCDPIGVWTNPQGEHVIIEGHGRKMALAELGHAEAPCIILNHLTDEERRAYALAHNQTTLMTGFDADMLALEMGDLADFELEDFGLDTSLMADAEDFGTDFELDDSDEPQYKTITLSMTSGQFDVVTAAIEAVGEPTMTGGNHNADRITEVCLQWAAR